MKLLLLLAVSRTAMGGTVVINDRQEVKYQGFERNGLEVFLGIPYGQDTSGKNRFKPPQPFQPQLGSTFDATRPGPACPQQYGQWSLPLMVENITIISEDCLNLNIVRPRDTGGWRRLTVMVWIHGGSFWAGSNNEPTHTPDGLILESVKADIPILHVAVNYRLGPFGFAQSEALKAEGSENAGLRDQRLAIEWVRDNIKAFGGDPERITVFGQSSGGLAAGLQLLAYGGTKPLPYQRGICQSQALEPGITSNFTINAMTSLVQYVGCNATSVHSLGTVACLRELETDTLLEASLATYEGGVCHNFGDIWLPAVDGDFLPAPPSQLLAEGRFGNASYMFGWTQDDMNIFTNTSIETDEDTRQMVRDYLPQLPGRLREKLLDLYPVNDFTPPSGTNLTAEFYRAARIFRDVLMVCEPVLFAEAMHRKGAFQREDAVVFFYHFNQTILEPILESEYHVSHLGAVHTSELAYMYGNLSHYKVSNFPFNPTRQDYDLASRASRAWVDFATWGYPGFLTDWSWEQAFWTLYGENSPRLPGHTYAMVLGGPHEGVSTFDGAESTEAMREQKLREQCALINSPVFIEHAGF